MPKAFFIRLVLLIITASSCLTQVNNERFNELYELYNKKDFFRFIFQTRQQIDETSSAQKLALNSFVNGLLNKPHQSNAEIDSLFLYYSEDLNDSLKLKLLETKLQNLAGLYDYRHADSCINIILEDYKYMLDSASLDDFTNFLEILKATKNLARQSTSIVHDTRVKMNKDLAGLMNIELTINGFKTAFIFDTGANISTIMKSNADKFKLKYLEGKIKVGTVTGIKVDANLAFAEALEIGDIRFENVLFIVLPDEALTFAGGFYKIDGIIGLPVLKEMKEIHFTGNELFVPMNAGSKSVQNLVFDGFTPVVNVVAAKDTVPFNFDTGARGTVLYSPYFVRHHKELLKGFILEEFEMEGAGGKKKIKGVELNQLNLSVGGSAVLLDDVKVFAEEIELHKYIYGNLGQDYMGNFDEMILNFQNMYIEFVKK